MFTLHERKHTEEGSLDLTEEAIMEKYTAGRLAFEEDFPHGNHFSGGFVERLRIRRGITQRVKGRWKGNLTR